MIFIFPHDFPISVMVSPFINPNGTPDAARGPSLHDSAEAIPPLLWREEAGAAGPGFGWRRCEMAVFHCFPLELVASSTVIPNLAPGFSRRHHP